MFVFLVHDASGMASPFCYFIKRKTKQETKRVNISTHDWVANLLFKNTS